MADRPTEIFPEAPEQIAIEIRYNMLMKRWFLAGLLLLTLPLYAGVQGNLRQGSKLYQQKKYGQAMAEYTEAWRKNPQNEQAAFGTGASAYYLKDYKTAETAFKQIAEKDGLRKQDALFNLGNTYYRAGQKEKAIEAYRQAILKNPKDKEAIHNLQIILQEQDNSNSQNNQNNNNSQDSSSNQQNGNQNNPAGSKPEDTQDTQPQESPSAQTDKEMAQRVMQMARENEQKPQSQGNQAASSYIEEDW